MSRYAAWTRRQAGTCSCGHVAAAVAAAGLLLALAAYWFVTRFFTVITEVLFAAAGAGLALAVTGALLALGEHRAAKWRRARCADCGAAQAIAEVSYANGLRSDTVRTCGPCWKRAEARAAAAGGTAPTWDVDQPGPGLPRIAEAAPLVPAIVTEGIPGLAPEPAAVPASPDNGPASGPLPPELAAYEGRVIPPSQWMRGHP